MKTEMLRLNQTSNLYTKRCIYRSLHIHLSIKDIRKPLTLWYLKSPFEPLFTLQHNNYQTLLVLLHPTIGSRHILEIARILSPIPGALQWMWRGGGTIGDQTGWASCFGTIEADPSRAGQGDGQQQIARDLRCFFKKGCWFTPWKINMEPENDGLEDDFPFQLGDF